MSEKSYLEEKLEDDAFRATYYEQACKLNEDELTTLRKRVEELEGIGRHYADVIIRYRKALEEVKKLKQNCQWPMSGKTNTPCVESGVNNPWICEYCIATVALKNK